MLQDRVLVFRNGKWMEGVAPAGLTRFADVKGYYANVIGYVRVVMCLVAGFTAVAGFAWLTAGLLLGSTLLDWLDGPVARRAGQCSIFGSGVDWLADVVAQVVTFGWLVTVMPGALPWVGMATAVELANCVFDFATTATGRYPMAPVKLRERNWFFAILDWSMPGGRYTWFGNTLWLTYPICLLAFCLGLARAGWWLVPLAALYIWCEAAWAAFIITSWTEPSRSEPEYEDAAFRHLGFVAPAERELLQSVTRQVELDPDDKRIYWLNIWQRSAPDVRMELDGVERLDQWARDLVATHYAGEGAELDGYGLIVNPRGSRAQDWHIDYAADYSTIFIPMSELTTENALQYAVLPSQPREFPNTEFPDPDSIDMRALAAANSWVSVRQLLAPEWSVLRMNFGAVHRGIANTGGFDRYMFWVSVKKGALLPPEPTVAAVERPAMAR